MTAHNQDTRSQKHVKIRTADTPNIIAVDPGLTTGVAFYNVRGFKSFHVPGDTAVQLIKGWATQRCEIAHLLLATQRFTVSAQSSRHSRQNHAMKINGALEAFGDEHVDISVLVQNAADASKACSDDVLRKVGWWNVGMPHANDAARHVGLTMLSHFSARWYEMLHSV